MMHVKNGTLCPSLEFKAAVLRQKKNKSMPMPQNDLRLKRINRLVADLRSLEKTAKTLGQQHMFLRAFH